MMNDGSRSAHIGLANDAGASSFAQARPKQHASVRDFVVAIDFGGTKIAVATAATTGSILKQARLDTHASQGAQQLLERTLVTAHALIERTVAEVGGECVAVGVVTPG